MGGVISEAGSKPKKIEAKERKSIGILKQIQFLIQGLGKYTNECGMINLILCLDQKLKAPHQTEGNEKSKSEKK